MGRNIIYTVKVGLTSASCEEILDWDFSSDGRYFCELLRKEINIYENIDVWGKITTDQLRWYAEKTNSDLVIFGKDDLNLTNPPAYLSSFHRACWLKFNAFEHFIKNDYEKFLFLDLDVYVKSTAKNIFETIKEPGLHVALDHNPIHTELMKNFLDTDIVHNSGVIYGDRASIEELYGYIPRADEWDSFLNKRKTNDQVVLSYLIQKHKIHTNLLDYKLWNMPWDFQQDETNFVHYYGAVGKLILHRLGVLNDQKPLHGISIKL